MKILTDDGNNFVIDGKEVKPEELTREDLLCILNLIYEDSENDIEIPEDDDIINIKNPVAKEIVTQIIKKIRDFKENIPNLRKEVESQFPNIPNSMEESDNT